MLDCHHSEDLSKISEAHHFLHERFTDSFIDSRGRCECKHFCAGRERILAESNVQADQGFETGAKQQQGTAEATAATEGDCSAVPSRGLSFGTQAWTLQNLIDPAISSLNTHQLQQSRGKRRNSFWTQPQRDQRQRLDKEHLAVYSRYPGVWANQQKFSSFAASSQIMAFLMFVIILIWVHQHKILVPLYSDAFLTSISLMERFDWTDSASTKHSLSTFCTSKSSLGRWLWTSCNVFTFPPDITLQFVYIWI